MRKIKSTISILLAVIMLLSTLPFAVSAADAVEIPSDVFEFNGHYYKLFDTHFSSMEEAESYCESMGGHLAIINDADEDKAVYGYLRSLGEYNANLGMHKVDGIWCDIFGKELTYFNWGACEPNNLYGKESIIDYCKDQLGGKWNDTFWGGLDLYNFICEWDDGTYVIQGTLNSYVISIALGLNKNWVSEVTIDGQKRKVKQSKLTNNRADKLQNKEVIAVVKNGEIIDIELLDDVLSSIVVNNSQNGYGAVQNYYTLIGEIQLNMTTLYQQMNNVFLGYKNKAKSCISPTTNEISLLAKDLKKSNKITVTGLNYYNANIQDGVFTALAECMSKDMGLSAIDIGNINSSSAVSEAKIINNLAKSFKSVKKSYAVGKENYVLNVTVSGNSFGASCSVVGITGQSLEYPPIYLSSSPKEISKTLTNYIEHLSQKVNDQIYSAFWSPIKECADVTGLSAYSEYQLTSFLTKANQKFLKQNGFGDVTKVFIVLKKCNDAISEIKDASTTTDLLFALKKGEDVYNKLNDINFSNLNYGTILTKSEIKMLEELNERAKRSLFNYLYGEQEKGWFESAWEKFAKKIGIHCPVDFEVYDENNNLIGWVDTTDKHEEYIWHTNDIMIGAYGGAKYLFLPDNFSVTLKLTATDDGTLDYIIEQKDSEKLSRLNYYDINLINEQSFDVNISASDKLKDIKDTLIINGETVDVYYEESDTAFSKIDVSIVGNGVVTGKGEYPYGDLVKLNAVARDDGTVFEGWYENDELISTESYIQFTSKEDKSLTAKFADKHIVNNKFYVNMGDVFEDVYAELYSVSNTESKICLSYANDLNISELDISCFDEKDEIDYNAPLKLFKNDDLLLSETFKTEGIKKIVASDSKGRMIAEFITKYSSDIKISSILLNDSEKQMKVGETFELLYSVVPAYANKNLNIVSNNDKVATISEDGTVTAIGIGQAVITIASKSDTSIKSTCIITVVNNSDTTKSCTCLCHGTGFLGFIYKIIRFFWKIFRTNKNCACGAAHY